MSVNKLVEGSTEKKKKKTTSIELFDVLNTKNNRANNPVPSTLNQPRALHSNAARWNETLTPKNFLMKKKKPKGLSIFKKKILMERLKFHIKTNLENKAANVIRTFGNDTEKTIASSSGSVIHVYNYIDDVDCSDPDEAMEACNDLKDLLQSTGNILSINVFSLSKQQQQKTFEYSSFVEVTLSNSNDAISAVDAINGIICGGKPIMAALKDIPIKDISVPIIEMTSTQPSRERISTSGITESSSGKIIISNMITEDAMQDAEEVQENLGDIYDLCSMFGSISRVWIEHCPGYSKPSGDEQHTLLKDNTVLSSCDPWVLLQFTSLDIAMTAVSNMRGRVVGGCTLSADYYDYYSYTRNLYEEKNMITADNSASSSMWLRLRGFTSLEEISDEEERAEVLENVLSLAQSAGLHITQNDMLFMRFSEFCIDFENPSAVLLDVCIPVVGILEAISARARLAQQCIAGKILQVDVVTMNLSDLSVSSVLYYDAIDSSDVRWICDCSGSAVVVVRSYLTEEDLEEEEGLVEVKRDLLNLAFAPSASLSDCGYTWSAETVSRVHIVRNNNTTTTPIVSKDVDLSSSSGNNKYLVGVDFRVETDAMDAMLQLDGCVVSGAALAVHCFRSTGFDSANIVSDGSTDVTTHNIIASKEYCSVPTHTHAPETVRAIPDMQQYHCVFSVGYDQQFTTALDHDSTDPPSPLPTEAIMYEETEQTGYNSEKSPPQGLSKYREAKSLPKLEVHAQPNLPLPVADEASNTAIKQLLRLISTFQARLKEKNPQKAKQKLRFVAGLKQCTNSVKGGKVRLLLLAPNTEANEVIDDRIETLIEEARLRDVPACYCLSKRILGKAAQMTMKQSVIAVLDPGGAYEFYKIILKFIKPSLN